MLLDTALDATFTAAQFSINRFFILYRLDCNHKGDRILRYKREALVGLPFKNIVSH